MADGVQFELDKNWDEFGAFLRDAAKSADNTQRKKYLKMVGGIMLASEKMIFDKDGAEAPGSKWKPLSPVTKAMRKKRRNLGGKKASGMKILRDTGNLRGSVSAGAFASKSGSRREVTPWEVVLGSTLPYAAAHQFGLKARTINGVQVRQHVRKRGRARGGKQNISVVSAHTRTQKWGAVPARPFVGWTNFALKATIAKAQEWFIDRPWLKNKKGGN